MILDDIDYIELYVGDAQQAAFYYCNAFGFRIVAEAGPESGLHGRRSILIQQAGVRILLTSALTPEDPAAEYVRLHGDGVKDIALRTSDAGGAFREAVARGATPVMAPVTFEDETGRVVMATIATMGDITHSFVQRESSGDSFMPGRYRSEDSSPSSAILPMAQVFSRVDHLAICLKGGSLDERVRFYEDVLGFRQSHQEHVIIAETGMNSKVVQSMSGRVVFTMLEPDRRRRPGQIDDFLARHGGPGVQHIALLTNDIVFAVRSLEQRTIEFLKTPSPYYETLEQRVGALDEDLTLLRKMSLLVDRDEWGYLLQIFTRSAHSRRTLFFELIQRNQAQGFGSNNIRTLYESVERERKRRSSAA